MDMLRSACFYFLLIVFVILSWSLLCDSRHLGHMEKKLSVNLDLLNKDNEEITKLEAPSTNKTNTLLSQSHAVVNHGDNGQINGKKTKEIHRVKRASDKKVSSKRVSRTWKIPKYPKKQPKSDQEHPGFNLDYMQPTTHPPHHN
ncbi:hypothetical protein AtNW77_Chr3g0217411 [Arabidopsis thaliana]|uniref:Root meristem growth factor 10 n=3 Tax=Arabidopsis TaxID=3701 RepID=RGF10_ARATH|nr:uncharacterized protein AT3G60650 [Arabidopsis thaliana]F4JBX1.1 RecName: Full=Root meristem growth factor 10; Short=AtRGF10; AltName: Full=CLAVATA3/ESR (CLE)-related protein CLELn; Short=AtCLELn; Short=Nuclear CLE-Like protein; Contains: RecName: Full=CLELn; Flags: Precursor [Arabidopsis thaliana]KAG7629216.1 hypothetical protein ISN45_At03g053700 [Arabidopsis thaliana x Arabidopsis arenosa]AEE80093.2 transmembrane protein [Arabidopsis thaliana]CAA0387695.1 unnamed protein product [Arabidop|eukprot:NP_001319807.1 transmembrane protein [Arabidopsis thaliana]